MEENSQDRRSLPEILLSIENANKTIIEKFSDFALNQQEKKDNYTKNSDDLTKSRTEFIKWRDAQKQELTQVFTEEKVKLTSLFETKAIEIGNIKVGLHEPTQNNINRLENFIKKFWKIPLFILLVSLLTTGITTYLAVNFYKESIKSKQEIITEYRTELKKENVIITKKDNRLLSDMLKWFDKNKKTRTIFVEWKNKNK